MPQSIDFGAQYLQNRIDREIVLAKHMGIIVEAADDGALVLRAPLAPNANHKGTAFGGSLYSLAVLTGWAWLTRDLALRKFDAAAVIQESTMRFLLPVHGEMRASAEIPAGAEVEKFHKMLSRAGRGRIRLSVQVRHGASLAAVFDGVFAAHASREIT
ncbi:MAG TPA: YiiD C-terminal domain-containing protein [Steroidobacteraceae bacterium]|jgi:thioesterase domain-containing protein